MSQLLYGRMLGMLAGDRVVTASSRSHIRNGKDKLGYRTTAPMGCAKRAVGTILAIRNPTERMLQVLIKSALVKEKRTASRR